MPKVLYPSPSLLVRAVSRRRHRPTRGDNGGGSTVTGPGARFSDWLSSLPRPAHLIPYGVLAALGAILLVPGVVPFGPGCDSGFSATAAERELFIRVSAVAFGLVAALLLLSTLTASAQRRGGRPGTPTIVATSLLGTVTLATVIWPHVPIAAPVQALMLIDVVAPVLSYGAALTLPLVLGAIAWRTLAGPPGLRVAQISAWATLLVALPLVMAITYFVVTPVCLG